MSLVLQETSVLTMVDITPRPITHSPKFTSLSVSNVGAKNVSSGAFGAGAGSTEKHQEFSWEYFSHQVPTHEKPRLGQAPVI